MNYNDEVLDSAVNALEISSIAEEGNGTFKEIYKEMPFGLKAIMWGAGLYAVSKAVKFGGWIAERIKGPKVPKDYSLRDREELLTEVTKWWKDPGYYFNLLPFELFVMFELMGVEPKDVIKHCEKKGTLEKVSLKKLYEDMYVGEDITEEEWLEITELDYPRKLFGKDQFKVICGHDECFYAYSVQKKKLYEIIGDEGLQFSEVTTFAGSNEDKVFDLSKISDEDIKNLKAGKPVAPYREPASEALYKIV